jgi:hypothetical protein
MMIAMTVKHRLRLAIALVCGLWVAAFGAERWVSPEPGLQISRYRGGEREPVELEFGSPPLRQSLAEVEQRLGPDFRIRYSGWIRIRHAGVYNASIEADRGAVVRLDVGHEPFVGLNSGESYPTQVFRELPAGLHAFELRYRHIGSGRPRPLAGPSLARLHVTWSKGIAVAQAIPGDAVFAPSVASWQFQLSAALRLAWVLLGLTSLALGLRMLAGRGVARAVGFRVASAVLGLAVSLCIAEVGLRVVGVEQREYVPGTIWLTYAYPRANSTTRYVGYLPYLVKEFDVGVHINSRGWRDREFIYGKQPGVFRIVVVGDSYVEGKEVELKDTFHKRLESRLNDELGRPDRRFEVIALSRGGISTEMELRVIRERAVRYAPDLVVLAFFAGNDVRGNLPSLEREYNEWANAVYGSIVIPARIACTDALTWLDGSRLNNVLTARLCDLYISHLHEFRDDMDAHDMISPDGAVFRGEYDARWRRAWSRSAELIEDAKLASEAMGASFLMLMVHSAQLVGVTDGGLASDTEKFNTDRPFEMLHTICEQRKIDCLDLRPPLERFFAETAEPYYWHHDAHWNENGHRVVADSLFERLTPRFSQAD